MNEIISSLENISEILFNNGYNSWGNTIRKAVALLKEQETELICNLLGGQPYEVYCRECRTVLCTLGKGETMNDVKRVFSYCPHCGRSVKWE